MKAFKERMNETVNVLQKNEVMVFPSSNLPPLDMIPRFEILDSVSLKKEVKRKRYN